MAEDMKNNAEKIASEAQMEAEKKADFATEGAKRDSTVSDAAQNMADATVNVENIADGDASVNFAAKENENENEEKKTPVEELSPLDKALLEIAELKEQILRRNADFYNLQQEYSNYVKRTKLEAQGHKEAGVQKVLETLLGVLDNAALAREHGELTGPAGKVVEELENTLRTNFEMVRFGAVGEEFDPTVHEALMHQHSAEAEKEEISVLIQAGYKQGEKVLRPARVGVVSPE